jgi:exodeoxyribonuclease VII large subunit
LLGEHMEEVGEGQLRLAFEALKNRLQGAGLFDPVHKKTLPLMPKTIGVITSPTGAAIRDILSVLRRRFTAAQVIIYPSMVQGATAAPTIVEAIKLANARNECDVLILARGGGSLEDLWPFNEEVVAHAIFASRLPVISGVGHEVDFTIADFVADVRAPTPSAAAELITPDQEELYSGLMHIQQRLLRYMRHKFQQLQQNLDWSAKNLQQQHPQRRLALQNEQLAIAKATLLRLQNQFITQSRAHLSTQQARLTGLTPAHRIRDLSQQLNLQFQGLKNHLGLKINKLSQRLGSVAAKLDALSPLATMQRGFAVATFGKKVLQTSDQVNVGDEINVRLVKGNLDCKVLEKN